MATLVLGCYPAAFLLLRLLLHSLLLLHHTIHDTVLHLLNDELSSLTLTDEERRIGTLYPVEDFIVFLAADAHGDERFLYSEVECESIR